MHVEGLQRVVGVSRGGECGEYEDHERKGRGARTECDSLRRHPRRAPPSDVEQRERKQAERHAAHPGEVRGVHSLQGLREGAETEQRAHQQRPRRERIAIGAHRAPAGENQEPDDAEQEEEPQEQLLRSRGRRDRPPQLLQEARALQEAVDV